MLNHFKQNNSQTRQTVQYIGNLVLPKICLFVLHRMDQEFYRRHSVTEMKEDSGKTLSAAARRSFFRRKQKHKRSSSKDSKEMVALDAISTDSIPFLDGEAGFTVGDVWL